MGATIDGSGGSHGEGQRHLGAGGHAAHSGAAAVALHAGDDGLAHAVAVGGDGVEVESGSTVPHEDLHPLIGEFGVHTDTGGSP